MKSFCYDYAVIGGDLRQLYLVRELAAPNSNVCYYALCQPMQSLRLSASTAVSCDSLEDAIDHSECILCPMPLSKDGVSLNQTAFEDTIFINQILTRLKKGQIFFAGGISRNFRLTAQKKGVRVFDFMQDITLAHFNSIATAEGVICEAIKNSSINLHNSRCAVLGYGKCGHTIAAYLKRMFCLVTVASLDETERAQAALFTDHVMDLETFQGQIEGYDFIFNTIPALILTRESLSHVKSTATILDIASFPGGVDFEAAKELSVMALSCLSLPGRYAPASSAQAIRMSIETSIATIQ